MNALVILGFRVTVPRVLVGQTLKKESKKKSKKQSHKFLKIIRQKAAEEAGNWLMQGNKVRKANDS